MPKPIKKKVRKKTLPEEEVLNLYEICMDYYERNRRFVHITAISILMVILLIIGGIFYYKNSRKQALLLEYEGYKLYHSLYQTESIPEEKRLKEALQKFEAAYKKSPSARLLLYIANTQYSLKQYDDTMRTLQKFIKKYSDNKELLPLAYYKMALVQMKNGKNSEAIETLKKIYQTRDAYLKDLALYEIGRLLEVEGKTEEAKEYYTKLVKEFPESPYSKVAQAKVKLKDEKGETKKETTQEEGK